ncbi:MAG: energy-coupling factor transporter ATPase [Ruminococcaceae bacterium]|nr:energy-coupling factor transporter ATPase [Oscillospiraceae bacterium]
MSNIIHAKNLTYTYPGDEDSPGYPALRGVDLDIEEGSFTAILGHNGSGKSTLAKILCMINAPDGGELTILGKDMTSPEITERDILDARRQIGMVFQNPDNQLVATIVEEDVAFGCENLGLPSAEIRRRVDEALDIVGMRKYARHAPHKLSGGQKQRIAIAGTIAMKRKCIIFDESTAMLDPKGRQEVMSTIERLNREEGITVLIITHHMNEAAMADRIIVLSEGTVLTEGTPGEVFGNPELLWSADLDVPQTTELLYKMRQAGYDVPLDIFDEEECARIIAEAMKKQQIRGNT